MHKGASFCEMPPFYACFVKIRVGNLGVDFSTLFCFVFPDTCGFASWEILGKIRENVDLFLYDLKLMDDVKHRKFTGVSNELILRNLQMLSERGHNIFLRVPIIPGINDDDENIRQTGAFAAALPCLNRVDILPYHHTANEKYSRLNKVYGLPKARPPSDERMAEIGQIMRGLGLQIKIGG